MLFKILKLLGLDVPAKIAAARTDFEHRVEEAADYVGRRWPPPSSRRVLQRPRSCSSLPPA
jgi:hypothetical protein